MDPLRPFATLIRSLWTASKPQATTAPRPTNAAAPAVSVASIESRLHSRLRSLSPWNSGRAREVFVETVLLTELGAELDADPDFQPLVREVSSHLGSVPAVSARLDEVLQALQRDPSVR